MGTINEAEKLVKHLVISELRKMDDFTEGDKVTALLNRFNIYLDDATSTVVICEKILGSRQDVLTLAEGYAEKWLEEMK